MADTWGTLPLPTTAPVGDDALGDPGLTTIGEFLQAAINADLLQVWNAAAPGTRAVEHVYTHDPRHKFNESKLPALYLFVESSNPEKFGDNLMRDTRVIAIYWVARPGSGKHESLRATVQNVLSKSIARACITGRHPAWRVASDTDPSAATKGSFLLPYAGLESMKRLTGRPLELQIQKVPEDQEKPFTFRGWATQIQVTEILALDAVLGDYTNTAEGTYRTNGDEETDADVVLPGTSV